MRPEQLSMQAFGCYLKETTVDFSTLNGRLFLITGSTGGGKTTLLDGICFALYCRATGGKRTWSDMRSIAAPQETPTMVEFSFRLGEERYRFRRSLKMHKVRGSDRVELRDEHACWRFQDGAWVLLVTGAESKVRDKAQELLGLSCEQFSQVVVLPQGEFRKLLLSNSTEKARIFQTLFQTERWERIARGVQQSAEEIKQGLDELFQNRKLLLEREQCADLPALEEKEKELARQIIEAQRQQEEWEHQLEQANREYSSARVAAEQYEQLDRLTAEQAVLQDKREEMSQAQSRWEQGRRIQELLPDYRILARSTQELEVKKNRLTQAAERRTRALESYQEAAQQAQAVEALRKEQETHAKSAALLEEARKNADKLTGFDRELAGARRHREEQEALRKAFFQAKLEAGKNVEAGERYVKECSVRVMELPKELEELNRLLEIERSFLQLEERTREWTSAERMWRQAVQEEQTARLQQAALTEKLERLESLLQRSAAAGLAEALRDGAPCPVCGSLAHPCPARGLEDIPQERQRTLLKEQCKRGEAETAKKSEEAAARLALVQAKQQAKEEQEILCRGYQLERPQVLAQREQAQKRVDGARKAQEQLPRAEKLLEKRRQEEKQALASEEACMKDVHAADTRIAELESGRQAVLEVLPKDYQSLEQLEGQYREQLRRSEELQARIRRLEEQQSQTQRELAQAEEQYQALEQNLKEESEQNRRLSEEYAGRCAQRSMDPGEPLEERWMGEEALGRLEREIAEYRERVTLVDSRLSEVREKLGETPRPELHNLEEALAQLQKQASEASRRTGVLSSIREQLDVTLHTLREEGKRSAALEREYEQTARVAQLLTGNNRRKVPIRMFVLGIMLDDILSRANIYFSTFSSGRYRLARPDMDGGGRGYNGLELEVFDGYSGGPRAVETLSGGELFLASLSLAFGLSDVVQGHSGGVRLDSIFIDEGFGSLDQETLDTAMRALDEIQRSGRTVGIISHVQELKSRIPAKIEVLSRGDGGSTVRVIC